MIKTRTISLQTTGGLELTHRHYHHQPKADTLAVLFPGAGYTSGPLLHYALEVALQANLDVLRLRYGFQAAGNPYDDTLLPTLLGETSTALDICLRHGYRKLVFISKSLGGMVASELAARATLPVKSFYMTPVPKALDGILRTPCVAVAGTADPFFTPSLGLQLRASDNVDLHILEGLDHSLESDADWRRGLDALAQVMGWLDDYLRA